MSLLSIVAVIVAIAALALVITPSIRLYRRFRGARLITCPETKAPAAVEVDAVQAAFSNLDWTRLNLKSCSRWPERQACGQECLRQVEESPEDCLIRSILTKWYSGKSCALCGKALGDIQWLEHKPALLGPDKETTDWSQFPPETVPQVLSTHQPACWDCHVASSFRRLHPDLVVDRPWKSSK